VYDDPKYAQVQKQLAAELARLRSELKVPEHDPPGASGGKTGAKAGAKKRGAA
jgi:hypothetical protein